MFWNSGNLLILQFEHFKKLAIYNIPKIFNRKISQFPKLLELTNLENDKIFEIV